MNPRVDSYQADSLSFTNRAIARFIFLCRYCIAAFAKSLRYLFLCFFPESPLFPGFIRAWDYSTYLVYVCKTKVTHRREVIENIEVDHDRRYRNLQFLCQILSCWTSSLLTEKEIKMYIGNLHWRVSNYGIIPRSLGVFSTSIFERVRKKENSMKTSERKKARVKNAEVWHMFNIEPINLFSP